MMAGLASMLPQWWAVADGGRFLDGGIIAYWRRVGKEAGNGGASARA